MQMYIYTVLTNIENLTFASVKIPIFNLPGPRYLLEIMFNLGAFKLLQFFIKLVPLKLVHICGQMKYQTLLYLLRIQRITYSKFGLHRLKIFTTIKRYVSPRTIV